MNCGQLIGGMHDFLHQNPMKIAENFPTSVSGWCDCAEFDDKADINDSNGTW